MIFKYSLEDCFAKAIMDKTPIVIVEGKDDRQIYQRIANAINVDLSVYQVNEFEEFGPGCYNVIAAFTRIQPKYGENERNIKWVAGIIDRDSRPYRGQLPLLTGLFISESD
jgi:hypothetical protein